MAGRNSKSDAVESLARELFVQRAGTLDQYGRTRQWCVNECFQDAEAFVEEARKRRRGSGNGQQEQRTAPQTADA